MQNNVQPFDLRRMFLGEAPPLFLLEVAFRTGFMYIFALIIIRIIGKRGIGEMTPFEYLIIIALGSSVGDPMFYPQVPLLHAMMVLSVIVILEQIYTKLSRNNERFQNFAESTPTLIVVNGKIKKEKLKEEQLNKEDLFMKLRENGIEYLSQVRKAYLEPSGEISVFEFKNKTIKKNSVLPKKKPQEK